MPTPSSPDSSYFCGLNDPHCFYALGSVLIACSCGFSVLLLASYRRVQRTSKIPATRRMQLNALSCGPEELQGVWEESAYQPEGNRAAQGAWQECRWMLGLMAAGCLIGGASWILFGVARRDFDKYLSDVDPVEYQEAHRWVMRNRFLLVFSNALQPLGFGLFVGGKLGIAVHMAGVVTGLGQGPAAGRAVMERHRGLLLGGTGALTLMACVLNLAGSIVRYKGPSSDIATFRSLTAAAQGIQFGMMVFAACLLIYWLARLRGCVQAAGLGLLGWRTRRVTISSVVVVFLLLLRGVYALILLFLLSTVGLQGNKTETAFQKRIHDVANFIVYKHEWIGGVLVLLGEPVAGGLGYWAVGRSRMEP